MRCNCVFVIMSIMVCGVPAAHADVTMSGLFSDHMVLQRNMEAPIWGMSDPGERISVTVGGLSATVIADSEGRWIARMGPLVETGPHTLTVSGTSNTLEFNDVLVGDVWFCSGQSNMQWAVKQSDHADAEIAAANRPTLRFFNVPLIVTPDATPLCGGAWRVCTPESVAPFSATAYFFGRELQTELDVPIGLIDCSSGGRPIECYMSRSTLASDPGFRPILDAWAAVCARFPETKAAYDRDMAEWKAAAEAARAAGTPEPREPYPPLGPGHWNEPGGLYNGSVYPVAPYGIRGALWYQGESNTDRAEQYLRLQPAMINDWRTLWGQGDLPFVYVQLPNYGARTPAPQPESRWAEFREAQRLARTVRGCSMAVTIDIGDPDDIHPTNKQDVGARLARLALADVYGRDIAGTGPMFKSAELVEGKIRLSFDRYGSNLRIGRPGSDDAALQGFVIAGPDAKFVPAQAEITGEDTVDVWADDVPDPVAVRYAWADNPACNLYNESGLPASPFRTDDWALESEGRNVTTFEFLGAPTP